MDREGENPGEGDVLEAKWRQYFQEDSDCAKGCCQVKLGEELHWSGEDEKLSAVGLKTDGRREIRDIEY